MKLCIAINESINCDEFNQNIIIIFMKYFSISFFKINIVISVNMEWFNTFYGIIAFI